MKLQGTDKIKCWNQCFVYCLKEYFSLNRIHFRSFDIALSYIVLTIDILRYVRQVMTQVCFLWKKQQNKYKIFWLKLFSLSLHHFHLIFFFNWQLKMFDFSLWNLTKTYKQKWRTRKNFSIITSCFL